MKMMKLTKKQTGLIQRIRTRTGPIKKKLIKVNWINQDEFVS